MQKCQSYGKNAKRRKAKSCSRLSIKKLPSLHNLQLDGMSDEELAPVVKPTFVKRSRPRAAGTARAAASSSSLAPEPIAPSAGPSSSSSLTFKRPARAVQEDDDDAEEVTSVVRRGISSKARGIPVKKDQTRVKTGLSFGHEADEAEVSTVGSSSELDDLDLTYDFVYPSSTAQDGTEPCP